MAASTHTQTGNRIFIEGEYVSSFHYDEDSWFAISKLRCGTKTKGPIADLGFVPGLTYRFVGRWEVHPRYGRQFSYDSCTQVRPRGRLGTVKYLAEIEDIGPTIASRIWNAYEENAFRALIEDPAAVSLRVRGLSVDVACKARNYIENDDALREARIELISLLDGIKVPNRAIVEILKADGASAAERIRANPWTLLDKDIHGVGFKTADAIHLKLGFAKDDPRRIAAAVTHLINESDSIWHTEEEIGRGIDQFAAGVDYKRAIKTAHEDGKIVSEEGLWAACDFSHYENYVFEKVKEAINA